MWAKPQKAGQRLLGGIVAVDRVFELELNGVLQKFHEAAFLFGPDCLNGLALVTAQGTKKERQAAFASKDVHTFAAHNLAAVSALVCGRDA